MSRNMRKVDVCVYDNARDYYVFINLIGEARYSVLFIRRGLLQLARSTWRGKFQGLNEWDEQVRLPTHFLYMYINLKN